MAITLRRNLAEGMAERRGVRDRTLDRAEMAGLAEGADPNRHKLKDVYDAWQTEVSGPNAFHHALTNLPAKLWEGVNAGAGVVRFREQYYHDEADGALGNPWLLAKSSAGPLEDSQYVELFLRNTDDSASNANVIERIVLDQTTAFVAGLSTYLVTDEGPPAGTYDILMPRVKTKPSPTGVFRVNLGRLTPTQVRAAIGNAGFYNSDTVYLADVGFPAHTLHALSPIFDPKLLADDSVRIPTVQPFRWKRDTFARWRVWAGSWTDFQDVTAGVNAGFGESVIVDHDPPDPTKAFADAWSAVRADGNEVLGPPTAGTGGTIIAEPGGNDPGAPPLPI